MMRRRDRIIKKLRKSREHRGIVMQALDLVAHKLRLKIHWEDYYRHGFYRQDMPWSEKALYVSDKGSYYWPWEGNSLKFDRLFIRKSLQKSVVAAEGLSTPHMLLKAGSDYAVDTGFMVEERVRNHEVLADICPLSLNTL